MDCWRNFVDDGQKIEIGRTVETRIMMGGQIVKVTGWFPDSIREDEAVRALRARHGRPIDLSRGQNVRQTG